MANIKVSEMTEATSFDDGDYTMIVQANQNKKISKENMLSDIPTIQNNISTINANIGDLSNLKTVDTTNIVNSINSLTGTILWTNPNPISDFNGQSIQLQTTDFDTVQIIYYAANNVTRYQSTGFIPVGESVLSTMMNAKSYIRPFRIIDNVLTFDNCHTYNSYNSTDTTVNNAALIPIYVIGYKTGLFNNEGE